jgi:hypothetical protein
MYVRKYETYEMYEKVKLKNPLGKGFFLYF